MEEQTNDDVTPLEVTSKPIKKRAVVQDDRDRDDNDSFRNKTYRRRDSAGQESNSLESKARRELLTYLSNKGIEDCREVQSYGIHVKLPKNDRHGDSWRSSTIITYTSPTGEAFTSKSEVFDALKASRNRPSLSQSDRAEIATSAQKKFSSFISNGLPATLGSIKVLHFGVIDFENSSFHNCVEIFPIGYKIELQNIGNGRSSHSSKIICEIASRNNQPEFRINAVSSGQTVSASSEASAWKKVLKECS